MTVGTHNGHGAGTERLRFFPKQLITADDLNQEQEYHRAKLREHNRMLHGWGVVCGCDVQQVGNGQPWEVRVCPGYVITPQGDAISIRSEVVFDVATCFLESKDPCAFARPCPPVTVRTIKDDTLYLAVRYATCETRPVRVAPHGCTCDDAECQYSRVADAYELCCLTTLPDTHAESVFDCSELLEGGHLVPCPECPEDPWVVLATLKLPGSQTAQLTNIDPFADRKVLYSTAMLQEMAICGGRGTSATWHSASGKVHHNNRFCNTGNNIEAENYRPGTGNLPLCKECAALARRWG